MPTSAEIDAQRARDDMARELQKITRKHTCQCGRALSVGISAGEWRLRCSEHGWQEVEGLPKRLSMWQRWQQGEPLPIEVVNQLERRERKWQRE